MKIWENFKTLSDARPTLQRKQCWVCCDSCKKKWKDIEPATQHVHMTIRAVQGHNVIRFVCDNCLTKIKSEDEAS